MKTKKYKLVLAACVIAGVLAPLGTRAATGLPFADGFETNALGGSVGAPWTVPGLPPTVENSPTSPDGSAQILYSPDLLQLDTDPEASTRLYSNVWWSAYAQVLPQTNASPDIAGAAAAFFLTDDGKLKAYSNNTWVTIATGVPTSGWISYAVHMDFNSGLYNVYKSGSSHTHGDTLELQNTDAPLAFNIDVTTNELTQVEVEGETTLDRFSLARGTQPITAGTPGMSGANLVNESSELVRDDSLLSGANLRFYGETNYLDGTFGVNLIQGVGLVDGDIVSVYVGGEGWRSFTYTGDGAWDVAGGSSYTVADTPITPVTGLRLDLLEEQDRVSVSASAIGSTEYTHPASTEVSTNWNLFALPYTANARTLANVGITPAGGDLIAVNDAENNFKIMRYNSGAWYPSWNRSVIIEPGTGFWYYRAGSDTTWSID